MVSLPRSMTAKTDHAVSAIFRVRRFGARHGDHHGQGSDAKQQGKEKAESGEEHQEGWRDAFTIRETTDVQHPGRQEDLRRSQSDALVRICDFAQQQFLLLV
jgi:hypothetical protein